MIGLVLVRVDRANDLVGDDWWCGLVLVLQSTLRAMVQIWFGYGTIARFSSTPKAPLQHNSEQ
jgi:hypothetical protein